MALDRRSYEMMVAGRDVPWLLRQWACRTPDKPFLIWSPHEGSDRSWSYGEFEQDVRRMTSGLTSFGIAKGARVLMHLDNCPELLICYFSCAAIGATAVLGNTRSTPAEVSYYLDLIRPDAIVTSPQFLQHFGDSPDVDLIFLVNAAGRGQGEGPRCKRSVIPTDELLSHPPSETDRPAEPMLDLRVQFTSGTTSKPKAVLSTHANSLFAAQQTVSAYGLRSDDICQVFVPLFHNNGLSVLVMSSLWAGSTILLQPKFSASNFWDPALKYGATWTSVPGSFFVRALEGFEVPKHSFRFWYIAVLPEIEERFRVKTRGHWGMSETISLPIVGNPFHEGGRLNIGRPAAGCEIAIRRSSGEACEAGEIGQLFVRGIPGITIFKEYFSDPTATAEVFDADGWFDTGDLVRIDECGDLFFAGRAKDVLRVGGENVAAAEIEAAIMASGLASECAVIGRPDDMLDEVPVAFVIPQDVGKPGVRQAILNATAMELAHFKNLREVYLVEDLPRSTLGKIAKHRLHEWILQKSGEPGDMARNVKRSGRRDHGH